MAQFDVYQNPSRNTRNAFPYLVDIQNPVISDIATRIVIPLGRLLSFKNESMINLTPEIEYDGEKLLLLTPQIGSIPSKILQNPIGSLNHFRDEIIAAIDFAITGI
ncbi:MAG: toxin CcdB [Oleispira sp.]|jgi:toxin CcdB